MENGIKMKVEVIRSIKITLPEPITVDCSDNSYVEIREIILKEQEAKELYVQLAREFDSQ